MRRSAGMGTLVDMGAVESMRATEGCEVRHVDAVFAEMVIGAARPVDRVDTERGDEGLGGRKALALGQDRPGLGRVAVDLRSEEHTSELQSLMRISYAVFCLKKKINKNHTNT